ncbi:ribonuclease H-like domain-containing protein [Tanacetum coccineum]
MSTLKFAETHNLVAFLEKPKESNRFEGIIDFLNASSIKYALTVNPTVYESCIKQFWATAKAKTVNRECQIQALVDKKKVIITEKSVRSDLMLEDAEGTECLPNDVIFEQLTLIGALRENWNRELVRRNVTVETTGTKSLVAQDGLGYDWSDQTEEGPTNFALMAYTSLGAYKVGVESIEARLDVYKKNEVVFKEDIKILKLDIKLRDNAITELRKKFEKAKKERDDLKLTLEKFENSSKNLSKLLDSQVFDKFKTGVGFDSQVVDSQVFDSQENDRYKTSEGYHAVPPPYTRNFMPLKSDLVLADEDKYVFSELVTSIPDVATSEAKTSESKPKSVGEPLIEDWISDSEDENETEPKSKQRKSSFAKVKYVKSNEHVKTPKESVKKVENDKQAKYPRKDSQSPRDCDFFEKKMVEKPVWNNARRVNHQNSQRMIHPHPKRNFVPRAVLMKSGLKTLNTARQNSSRAAVSVNTARLINTAYPKPIGNPQLEFEEKGVIDSGFSRNMIRNKSYLSDYEEIDGVFVAFGGDPKGGRITAKGKISTDTECVVLSPDFLLNENHVLLRVPRKDNMYNVDLKNIVPLGGLTYLFAKATLDESILWHRRLGHINFKTMNKLVRGNLVRGLPSKIFENNQTCVACQKGKQHKASCKTKTIVRTVDEVSMATEEVFDVNTIRSSFANKMNELRQAGSRGGVAIPLEAVKEVSSYFNNTLYGYFVGKRLAFPLVENYVKNTWIKYGLEHFMNKNGFLFFKFSTRDGMERVIENGSWLIRSVPLILNIWTPNAQVKKEKINTVPVWVKLHHVPSDYARALVQVSTEKALHESVVVAIPFLNGMGHSLETVNKKAKAQVKPKHIGGVRLSKPMPNYYYRRVEHGETSKADGTNDKPVKSKLPKDTEVVMKNSFKALVDDETLGMSDETAWIHAKQSLNVIISDREEVDQVIELETNPCMSKEMNKDKRGQPGTSNVTEGASTPVNTVPDNWTSNGNMCSKGTCIILGWNSNVADVTIINQMDQAMQECVKEIKVLDVVSTGLQFTWNQKPKGNDGILTKIDHVMVNLEFNDMFMGTHAIFMPYRISDHAPAEGMATHVSIFFMFQVVKKLKLLKKPFRKLLFMHGNLHENVKRLRFELDQVQTSLDSDPFNSKIRLEEAAYLHAFNDALLMEERFLKQKFKIEWLKLGDSNTTYFHKAVKSRISRNRVEAVLDSNGALLTNDQVTVGFVKHYGQRTKNVISET